MSQPTTRYPTPPSAELRRRWRDPKDVETGLVPGCTTPRGADIGRDVNGVVVAATLTSRKGCRVVGAGLRGAIILWTYAVRVDTSSVGMVMVMAMVTGSPNWQVTEVKVPRLGRRVGLLFRCRAVSIELPQGWWSRS